MPAPATLAARMVTGAPPGDQHGLRCGIIGDLLRGAGFEVIDLGASTPAESFLDSSRANNRLVAVTIAATM